MVGSTYLGCALVKSNVMGKLRELRKRSLGSLCEQSKEDKGCCLSTINLRLLKVCVLVFFVFLCCRLFGRKTSGAILFKKDRKGSKNELDVKPNGVVLNIH